MLLANGASLEQLLGRAAECGYEAIELRQGSLAEGENDQGVATPAVLAKLASRHPQIEFDYAMAFPFMSERADYRCATLATGVEAALATGGQTGPHLRLVDIETSTESEASIVGVEQLSAFAIRCREQGVRLSLEHSRQPWAHFSSVLSAVRARLNSEHFPSLCLDPANFCILSEQHLSLELLRVLPLESVSMVHLKQWGSGSVLPELLKGDVCWQELHDRLRSRAYTGPLHMEIAPTAEVWERLEASWRYWGDLASSAST